MLTRTGRTRTRTRTRTRIRATRTRKRTRTRPARTRTMTWPTRTRNKKEDKHNTCFLKLCHWMSSKTLKYKIIQLVTTISIVYTTFAAICQSKIRTSQGLYHKDKDKDQIHKDKDLKLVLKESLRTRTRINITANVSYLFRAAVLIQKAYRRYRQRQASLLKGSYNAPPPSPSNRPDSTDVVWP